jgi:hypothetical protein
MRMPLRNDRLAFDVDDATQVMPPMKMPEPPTPHTARAPMSIDDDLAPPARAEPTMNMATKVIMVNFNLKKR